VFDGLLDLAAEKGIAAVERGQVRHPKAAVSALAEEKAASEALLALLRGQGLAPASIADLAQQAGVSVGLARKVLGQLVTSGAVVRLSGDLCFASSAIETAREGLVAYLEAHPDGATTAQLKDPLGVSRKYAVPLLEYFDSQGVTRREGDLRVLR
jgi:selenocysteine-specific elongation factor